MPPKAVAALGKSYPRGSSNGATLSQMVKKNAIVVPDYGPVTLDKKGNKHGILVEFLTEQIFRNWNSYMCMIVWEAIISPKSSRFV